MSLMEQPSVLTVCVPGTSAEPGSADLNQILAARRKAATQSAGLDCDSPDRDNPSCDNPSCDNPGCGNPDAGIAVCPQSDCSKSGSQCAACDDSACGVKVLADRASGAEVAGRRLAGDELEPALHQPGASLGVSFFHADSGKKALELLRMLRFDLLVTGDRLPDMPIGQFLRRVRVAWPWQKWALVGSSITTQDEIAARSLGAMAVFDAPPDWEVLSSLAITAADQAAGLKLAFPREGGAERLQRLGPDPSQSRLADRIVLNRPLAAAVVADADESASDTPAALGKVEGCRTPSVARRMRKRSVG